LFPAGVPARLELLSNPRMALITCPECGKQVSTGGQGLSRVRFPVAEQGVPTALSPVAKPGAPGRWTLRRFSCKCVLRGGTLAGICSSLAPGPLLIALYRRHSYVMRIIRSRFGRERFLVQESSEFFIKDIRSIDVRQGVWAGSPGSVTFTEGLLTSWPKLVRTAHANVAAAAAVPQPVAVRRGLSAAAITCGAGWSHDRTASARSPREPAPDALPHVDGANIFDENSLLSLDQKLSRPKRDPNGSASRPNVADRAR